MERYFSACSKRMGIGTGKRAFALLSALVVFFAIQQSAFASPAPVPAPNPYNQVLIDAIPDLKGLGAPEWLLPGYRLFYDVYYYDIDDKVIAEELLIVDVKGRGDSYVLTCSTTANFDEQGGLISIEEDEHVIDFTGLGEVWISPSALSDSSAPAAKSGIFRMGMFENMVQFDEDGRAWAATVDVKHDDKGSSTVDIYYDRKNGLALLFDIYVYSPQGEYIGGAAIQYRDYVLYEAPWLGEEFSAFKEGTVLEYDLRIEHKDGKVETGTALFTVQENHGGWMKVLEERNLGGTSATERNLTVSGFSVDGLLLALPGGTIEGLQDGFTYFYDGYTAAMVVAKGPVKLEGEGEGYEVIFKDGMIQASSVFRAKDGLMVGYTKGDSLSEPYVTTLIFKGIK